MELYDKRKISASEASEAFLESLNQMLLEYWPQMVKILAPTIRIPVERLMTDEAFGHVFLAIVSTHYYDLPKLFDGKVTESLRRSILYEITRQDYSLGDILKCYFRTMEAAEKEGELYLTEAAALLSEKLVENFILCTGEHRMFSLSATMVLTKLFVVLDLDWWKRLHSEFKVVE